jgi:hypothetical protein
MMTKVAAVALALVGPGLLGATVAASVAGAQPRPKAPTRAVPATLSQARTPADSDAVMVQRLAIEERAAAARLGALRGQYLRRAAWADLGDRCSPGALRVFPRDTSAAGRDSVQRVAEAMEQIVVTRGVGSSLAGPDARRLLRLIVGWEAGVERPMWDVATGEKPRRTIATGLMGEVPDPNGPGCLPSAGALDTVTFVVPGFSSMEFPNAPKPRVKAYYGPDGYLRARDEFFAEVGSKNPEADLLYVVVAPMVLWKDYAVVGVRRPQERGGVQVGDSNRGGASYLFRKTGQEWRLLSIVRSWGG